MLSLIARGEKITTKSLEKLVIRYDKKDSVKEKCSPDSIVMEVEQFDEASSDLPIRYVASINTNFSPADLLRLKSLAKDKRFRYATGGKRLIYVGNYVDITISNSAAAFLEGYLKERMPAEAEAYELDLFDMLEQLTNEEISRLVDNYDSLIIYRFELTEKSSLYCINYSKISKVLLSYLLGITVVAILCLMVAQIRYL